MNLNQAKIDQNGKIYNCLNFSINFKKFRTLKAESSQKIQLQAISHKFQVFMTET